MTPETRIAYLRNACWSLGSQTRMAKLLGVSSRALRYKLVGRTPITDRDLRAINDILREEGL